MIGSIIPEIIRVDAETARVYLRDGVTLSLFFGEPTPEVAEGLAFAFQAFLEIVPPEDLRWASLSANAEEWKPFKTSMIQRCKKLMEPAGLASRELTFIQIQGGDAGGPAPGVGFALFVTSDLSEYPTERNLLQMYFPSRVVEASERYNFVKKVKEIVSHFPVLSGYCSPGLHWMDGSPQRALKAAFAIGLRYPGFDIEYNQLGRDDLADHLRGARWITFIGPGIMSRLLTSKSHRLQFPAPISTELLANTTMILASESPEVGDTNRQVGVPSISAVARMLEPVTQFDEPILLRYGPTTYGPEILQKWERRFWEQS